jgi:hypothetical protein
VGFLYLEKMDVHYAKEKNTMPDRINEQPTPLNQINHERRSGKDRRKVHTMVNPDKERRKKDRRKKRSEK